MSESDSEHMGSFADGQRTQPLGADAPGHFSEGQETVHAVHLRMGSFADTSCPGCAAVESFHAEHVRKGSFADTYCPKCQAMAGVDHATTVRRLYEHLNAGDIDGFAGLLSDGFIEHEVAPGLAPTKAGVKDFFRMQRAAFPDLRMSVEDLIASGDRAVARIRYTGTNRGDFMGMGITNKAVDVQLIDVFGFGADGRVHEHWGVMDMMGMLQQLGLAPAGPSA